MQRDSKGRLSRAEAACSSHASQLTRLRRARRTVLAAAPIVALTLSACLDPAEPDRRMAPEFLISGVDPNAIDLGMLGYSGFATGINADGTVVGYGSPSHAFIIPPGGEIQRLMPADTESVAWDINDAGQVTGDFYIAQGTQARGFVWTPGASPELLVLPPLPGGDQAQAFAINNAGVVVGVAQPQVGVFHAVLWNASGAIQDLATLGGTFAEAHDINDVGVVVGLSRNAAGVYRGFRWSAATGMQELPALPGPDGGFASANAVNNAGQIVGEMKLDSGLPRAVFWDTTGAIIELDPQGTSQSAARAITEDGVIVGTRSGRVFAWDPDTHTLFDVGAGNGEDVNAAGRIVGWSPSYPYRATAWQLQLEPALTIHLALAPDSLHPRVRVHTSTAFPFLNQPVIPPDTAEWTVAVLNGVAPVPGVSVEVRAEYLAGAGGEHAHLPDSLRFEDATDIPAGYPDAGLPVVGHFKQGANRTERVQTTASTGILQGQFVAGHISGPVRLIASTTAGGTILADTAVVWVRVPGLKALVSSTDSIRNARFVGWTNGHPFRSNWYLRPDLHSRLQGIVNAMADTVNGRYLYLNDASLPLGGRFEANTPFDPNPYGANAGHRTHTHGIDIDARWCYASSAGVDPDQMPPHPCYGAVSYVDIQRTARLYNADVARETRPLHFHIRFR